MYIASIKPNTLIILNLDIYQEKKNNEKRNRNKYTKVILILRKVRRNQRSNQKS